MPKSRPERGKSRSRRVDGSATDRRRLRAVMRLMVATPVAAGVLALGSSVAMVGAVASAESPGATATLAMQLNERQAALEARLVKAAAAPSMSRLADGIAGQADRRLASRTLAAVRGPDGQVLQSACVVRGSDLRTTDIRVNQRNARTAACAGPTLLARAAALEPGGIARESVLSPEGEHRLLIATPMRNGNGVVSAEIAVETLFASTHEAAGVPASTMLFDHGRDAVVAHAGPTVPVDGAEPLDDADLASFAAGIASGSSQTAVSLATRGLGATVVPLWGDGATFGLIGVAAAVPAVPADALALLPVVLVMAAVVVVLALVVTVLFRARRVAQSEERVQILYDEADEEARFDSLTGLGNRRAFDEGLTRLLGESLEKGLPMALALIDIDDLKVVNDAEGHDAGDDLLVGVAETMQQLARPDDVLYRIGGDEFAMILPAADAGTANSIVNRILHFCKRPPAGLRPSSFSGAITAAPYFGSDGAVLFRQAQASLDWVKSHGRGAVEVFDPDRDRVPDHARDVARSAIQEVMTSNLLSPVFQPIVDLQSGRVLGFEGLIRPDPAGPLPDTERLFAAAAASGRTVELDLACIEVVLAGARSIGPDQLLTLNLSPRTLEVKDFDAAWLLQGLMRNGISPSRVIVELTERESIGDLRRLRQTFANLQRYGLRLAADDVGAGNSGLRLLSQVRFDIVKIDLSLVHAGARDEGSRAVLRSLRDLATSQRATLVAEGLETKEQLRVMQDMQIGAGQGYLLGRPASSTEATFVDLRGLASYPAVAEVFESTPAAIDAEAAGLLLPAGSTSAGSTAELPARAAASSPVRLAFDPDAGLA